MRVWYYSGNNKVGLGLRTGVNGFDLTGGSLRCLHLRLDPSPLKLKLWSQVPRVRPGEEEERREARMISQKAQGFKVEGLGVRCHISAQPGTELTAAELGISFFMEA